MQYLNIALISLESILKAEGQDLQDEGIEYKERDTGVTYIVHIIYCIRVIPYDGDLHNNEYNGDEYDDDEDGVYTTYIVISHLIILPISIEFGLCFLYL